MTIDPTGNSTSTNRSVANGFSALSSEEFIRVLFAELQNQDPFQPSDSAALLEQLSSIRNIESQLSLQQQMESLVTQNQLATAGNLIGKLVAGLDDLNNQAVGLVTSVRLVNNKVVLELDSGQSLTMDRVTDIASADLLTQSA